MEVDELNGLQSGLIRIGTFSSVATHWLPNIIRAFQTDYPNIEYELLPGVMPKSKAGSRRGVWTAGLSFCRPTDFETVFLEQDRFLAVLPENPSSGRV